MQQTIVCMDHTLFTHSSTDGHLGCFLLLAIVNNAATSMIVQISLQVPVFILWGIYPNVELMDRMVILVLVF